MALSPPIERIIAEIEELSGRNVVVQGDPSIPTLATVQISQFLAVFMHWTRTVRHLRRSGVVAIDGKALRRSKEAGNQARVIVGGWGARAGISFWQMQVNEKSNEITAVPEMLETLSIMGCIITIDTMGYQKEVAAKVRAKGGEYPLAPVSRRAWVTSSFASMVIGFLRRLASW